MSRTEYARTTVRLSLYGMLLIVLIRGALLAWGGG